MIYFLKLITVFAAINKGILNQKKDMFIWCGSKNNNKNILEIEAGKGLNVK